MFLGLIFNIISDRNSDRKVYKLSDRIIIMKMLKDLDPKELEQVYNEVLDLGNKGFSYNRIIEIIKEKYRCRSI